MSNTLTNIRKSSGGHSGLGSYLFPQKVRPKVPESPNIKALTSRRIFTLRRSHSNYYHRLYTSSHYRFDPYSDPYHGKTGRHTLTSNKIYFSKKSGIATLSGTWSDTPAHGKIQYIPVRIPPSLSQKTTLFVVNRVVFLLLSAVFQRIMFTSITAHFRYTPQLYPKQRKYPARRSNPAGLLYAFFDVRLSKEPLI